MVNTMFGDMVDTWIIGMTLMKETSHALERGVHYGYEERIHQPRKDKTDKHKTDVPSLWDQRYHRIQVDQEI